MKKKTCKLLTGQSTTVTLKGHYAMPEIAADGTGTWDHQPQWTASSSVKTVAEASKHRPATTAIGGHFTKGKWGDVVFALKDAH